MKEPAADHAAAGENSPQALAFRDPLPAQAADSGDAPHLRVFIPDGNGFREENVRRFSLSPDRWEQIEVPMPTTWRGESLLLVPGGGWVDVAGVRIVSEVMGEVVWQLRGEDLISAVQVTAGAQTEPHARLLRLRCTGTAPQILLPEVDLRGSDEPLRLEIGIRVRPEPTAQANGAHFPPAAGGQQASDSQLVRVITDWQAAERSVRAELEQTLTAQAITDGRVAALQAQLDAANEKTAQLAGQLEIARTEGEQQAAGWLLEVKAARAHADERVAVIEREVEAAHARGDERVAAMLREVEMARAFGEGRVASLRQEVDTAHARADAQVAAMLREVETARMHGDERVAAIKKEVEAAHAHGDERVAAMLREVEMARAHGDEREAAVAVELERLRAEFQAAGEEHESLRAQAQVLRDALTSCWEFLHGVDVELRAVLEASQSRLLDAETELRDEKALRQQIEAAIASSQEQLEGSQSQLLDVEAELREMRDEKALRQRDEEFLRQDIAGMQQELQALDETLVRAGRQQAETQAVLAETLRRAEDDHGRVRSMRRSASWKMTLPLRVVNRLTTGRRPAQKNGAVSTDPALPLLSAEEVKERNGGYRFQLDEPTDWILTAQQVRFRGWCLPPADSGKPVPSLRVRTSERTTDVPCDLPRFDVLSALGGPSEWRLCGFDVKIDFSGGPSQVAIEAVDETGAVWLVGQYKVRAPYAPWVLQPERPTGDDQDYAAWVESFERLSVAERREIRARARTLAYRPLISVIMPVYNTPEAWLVRALDSVRRQLYPFWELCIADDCSPAGHVHEVLERYARLDNRIKVVHREKNGHISAASNSALALASGEFVALLDHDDELPAHALYAVALELQDHPEADLLYSDEDKIDEQGRRHQPYFKPDWNPDLLLGQNFVSHLGVYRREIVNEVGGFRAGYEGCQDWDLVLRVTERIPAAHIRHIPRVLYHWRAIEGSTARAVEEKDYIVEASRRVLQSHCERTGKDAEILSVPGNHYRVRYLLPEPPPLVSIIIPTHNQLAVLRQGIETLRARTTYPNYEILVVDNRSDDPATLAYLETLDHQGGARVLRYAKPFNYSAINNFAVENARGELVCLMNNDMEVITPGWLEEMASHALRPDIGAVGAILYYPDDLIQHAGVVLGIGGVAGHIFSRLPRGTPGYFNRARLVQNYSAVTAACLALRRSTYQQVGGMNETLKVAFNDVDFCLKIRAAGFRNLWTPYAEFYHHESASRGADDTIDKYRRFISEVEYMQANWHAVIEADPAYNPNLSTAGGECLFASPPRVLPLLSPVVPGAAEPALVASA